MVFVVRKDGWHGSWVDWTGFEWGFSLLKVWKLKCLTKVNIRGRWIQKEILMVPLSVEGDFWVSWTIGSVHGHSDVIQAINWEVGNCEVKSWPWTGVLMVPTGLENHFQPSSIFGLSSRDSKRIPVVHSGILDSMHGCWFSDFLVPVIPSSHTRRRKIVDYCNRGPAIPKSILVGSGWYLFLMSVKKAS